MGDVDRRQQGKYQTSGTGYPFQVKVKRDSPRILCWANLKTPEEARKGLCILATELDEPDCRCVADECTAMWRWEVFDSNGKPISKRNPTHGYCAAGGQP